MVYRVLFLQILPITGKKFNKIPSTYFKAIITKGAGKKPLTA